MQYVWRCGGCAGMQDGMVEAPPQKSCSEHQRSLGPKKLRRKSCCGLWQQPERPINQLPAPCHLHLYGTAACRYQAHFLHTGWTPGRRRRPTRSSLQRHGIAAAGHDAVSQSTGAWTAVLAAHWLSHCAARRPWHGMLAGWKRTLPARATTLPMLRQLACLGSKYREAGQYAVDWGVQLQELVLDRTQLAPNGGYVAVTSLVEVPPACQRLLAVADRIYAWNPRVYSLVEAALDATATKLLLAACASGPACAQGQRLKLSAEHIWVLAFLP